MEGKYVNIVVLCMSLGWYTIHNKKKKIDRNFELHANNILHTLLR